MKHYELEINLLLDGELLEDEKEELFNHLAECPECRKAFSEYAELKDKSNGYCTRLLAAGKTKNFSRHKQPAPKFYKRAFYLSSAAALLFIFLQFNQKPSIQYITKNEVRVDTVFVPKEKTVIKQAKGNIPSESNQKNISQYLASIKDLPLESHN